MPASLSSWSAATSELLKSDIGFSFCCKRRGDTLRVDSIVAEVLQILGEWRVTVADHPVDMQRGVVRLLTLL